MYKINNSITMEDYMVFNEYHLTHSKQGKFNIKIQRMIMPMISFLCILIFWIIGVDVIFMMIELIILSVLSIISVFYAKKNLVKSIKKNIDRLEKEGKLPFIKESIILIDDNYIVQKSDQTEMSIRFDAIEKIIDNTNVIYIYFGAIQAFVIPYRNFESNLQREDFMSFLKTKCNSSN